VRRLILAVLALAVIGGVVWWLRGRADDDPVPESSPPAAPDEAARVAPQADHEAAHAGARTAPGPTNAPPRPPPPRAADPRAQLAKSTGAAAADALVERLAAKIELAPDVREALQQVLREEREAAAALVEREADEEARLKALDQLRADTHAQVESLLSPEQLAAYRELRPR
jgi:hypothetical protein